MALVDIERYDNAGKPTCDFCALSDSCQHKEVAEGSFFICSYVPGPDCPVHHGTALRDALIEYQTWYDEHEGCDTADMTATDVVDHFLKLKAHTEATWPPKETP